MMLIILTILKTLALILPLILFLLLSLSTSNNSNSDGMIAFRVPSSARGKGTLKVHLRLKLILKFILM